MRSLARTRHPLVALAVCGTACCSPPPSDGVLETSDPTAPASGSSLSTTMAGTASTTRTSGTTAPSTADPDEGDPSGESSGGPVEVHCGDPNDVLAPPDPNGDRLEGYSPRISIAAGDSLQLLVSSDEPLFAIDILRFGSEVQPLASVSEVSGTPQPIATDGYRLGASWTPTVSIETDADWPSGLYAARLCDASDHRFDIPFVVREPRTSARILVIMSDFTWQAYNCWGGGSFYGCGPSGEIPYKLFVHRERPLVGHSPSASYSHTPGAEKFIAAWLESVGYRFATVADSDVHDDPALLRRYDTVILNSHSEYWSEAMYDGLVDFLDDGGNLLYLGGNGIHWKVTVVDDVIEVRKDNAVHTHDGTPGGLWRDLGRSAASVVATEYDLAGTSFQTYAPFAVIEPEHWIFEGTNLGPLELFGAAGLNYPPDAQPGASGWEMDKMTFATPGNTILLAQGTNPVRPSLVGVYDEGIGADMTYYEHPGGGGVFSASSITFTGSLAVDEACALIVDNVLTYFGHLKG